MSRDPEFDRGARVYLINGPELGVMRFFKSVKLDSMLGCLISFSLGSHFDTVQLQANHRILRSGALFGPKRAAVLRLLGQAWTPCLHRHFVLLFS
jgi:hypothetical protein